MNEDGGRILAKSYSRYKVDKLILNMLNQVDKLILNMLNQLKWSIV